MLLLGKQVGASGLLYLAQPTSSHSDTLTLNRIRAATGEAHARLEARFDAIERLADPAQRDDTIRVYGDLYLAANEALGPTAVALGLGSARRADAFAGRLPTATHAPFPDPATAAEALGMLYVIEGSTLGGRIILRQLAARGIDDPRLAFLDPYGADTGRHWRDFLAILERETSDDAANAAEAVQGAIRGFRFAEATLCGGPRP